MLHRIQKTAGPQLTTKNTCASIDLAYGYGQTAAPYGCRQGGGENRPGYREIPSPVFLCGKEVAVAKKGTMQPTHRLLGLRMDRTLREALEASALKNERKLAEEARYAIRLYLGIQGAPASEPAAR